MRGELRPGDTTSFQRGPQGAHQLINRTGRSTRVLIVSTMLHPEVAHYPDSDEIAVFAGAPPVPGEDAPVVSRVKESARFGALALWR